MSWLYDDSKTIRELATKYNKEVRAVVYDAILECRDSGMSTYALQDITDWPDKMREAVDEQIQQCADTLVIYTIDAEVMLLVSRSDDAWEEYFEGKDRPTTEQRAYCAFVEDCHATLADDYAMRDIVDEIIAAESGAQGEVVS
jgi:hypothetical protein